MRMSLSAVPADGERGEKEAAVQAGMLGDSTHLDDVSNVTHATMVTQEVWVIVHVLLQELHDQLDAESSSEDEAHFHMESWRCLLGSS